MLDGFKKFIARGNMVDMAVGVVMGAAVTGIVNALVDSIINPLIAAIFGKPDLSKTWNWTITNWAGENSVISFGSLLNALLNFLIIAIAVEKAMAKIKKGGDEDVAASQPDLSPEEQTVILLQDIRNSLAAQQAAAAAPETSAAPTATVTVESK